MPADHSSTSSIAPLAIRNISRHVRARRKAAPLAVHMGKHFGRVIEANASFAIILDQGLELELESTAGKPVDPDDEWVMRAFKGLCRMYDTQKDCNSKGILESLRDPEGGMQFRNELCLSLQEGRSTGRTDDIMMLQNHISVWPNSPITGATTLGWNNPQCAMLLSTESMQMDNQELLEQLRDGITEAPHDEIPRFCFEDERFPTEPTNPLQGFGRSKLFVHVAMGIFNGPGSVKSARSGGSRGKAAKNGMTSFTKESIAYISMLLRFVLRNSGGWYKISNEAVDTRFNYDIFYMEILALLEDPLFEKEVNDLLAFLNGKVFPHAHAHARRIRTGGSSMRQKVADARARRIAEVEAAEAVA
ncbi:unnamed protein product [Rhizoctonia solani]|uniref:Uncharacterized protein n=1 Tax=Rhizoctonia solani TaxID=456999 RepID=A0A8H3BS40_9AGAM|nr:unnamed protein product [Rhizoctonia solani]